MSDTYQVDLTVGGCFGQVVAFLYCVEFQKRGLPHVHILIILANQDRTLTPELVDDLVTAELPPSPDEVDDFGKIVTVFSLFYFSKFIILR